eukprot:6160078-Amphidinium_carterae.1
MDFNPEVRLGDRQTRYTPQAFSETFYEQLRTRHLQARQGQTEKEVQDEQNDLKDKIMQEHDIMVKQTTLTNWVNDRYIDSHNIDNHTKTPHGNHYFHVRIKCAINDYALEVES